MIPLIAPSFRGDLDQNAAQLSDYFLTLEESAVPVESFLIESDGKSFSCPVEDGRYRTALWLLYNALAAKSPTYTLSRAMKRQLPLYYGDELVIDAKRPETKHQALWFLLGDNVRITLRLRAGYTLPRLEGRTLRELIEFGWQIREAIRSGRPAPLVRGAVSLFMDQVASNRIRIIESTDPNDWPSLPWLDRVQALGQSLKVDIA